MKKPFIKLILLAVTAGSLVLHPDKTAAQQMMKQPDMTIDAATRTQVINTFEGVE